MLVSTLPRLPLPSDSLVATPSPFDELLIGEDKEAPIPQEADVEVRVNEDVTETKSYNCTYAGCNKVFRNSSKLSRHFRTHTGERPFLCAHGDCGKSFSRREHLRRHLYSHTGTRPFSCTFSDECQYSFVDAHQLKRHLRTHERKLPYVCDSVDCSAAFNKSHQLREHMFVHTGLKAFSCSHAGCELSFVGKAALNRHVKAHNKLYACLQCSCSFSRFSERQRHMREAHPLRCEHAQCSDKRFRCRSRLRAHMQTHENERVVCPQPDCDKSFSRASNLQTHIRAVHQQERPFVCTQCDSAFAYKQSLQRHERVHNEPKPAPVSRRHSLRTTLCGRRPREQSAPATDSL